MPPRRPNLPAELFNTKTLSPRGEEEEEEEEEKNEDDDKMCTTETGGDTKEFGAATSRDDTGSGRRGPEAAQLKGKNTKGRRERIKREKQRESPQTLFSGHSSCWMFLFYHCFRVKTLSLMVKMTFLSRNEIISLNKKYNTNKSHFKMFIVIMSMKCAVM